MYWFYPAIPSPTSILRKFTTLTDEPTSLDRLSSTACKEEWEILENQLPNKQIGLRWMLHKRYTAFHTH